MALIKCKECKKEISSEAKTCPQCGAKVKKPMSPIIKYSLLGVIAFIVISTAIKENDPSTQAADAARKDIGTAEAACQLAFEKVAKDPSSVDWIRPDRQFQYTNNEKTKALSIQPVRAKNSFNALTLGIAKCELEKINDNWQMTKLTNK